MDNSNADEVCRGTEKTYTILLLSVIVNKLCFSYAKQKQHDRLTIADLFFVNLF